jgi:hypothetical protein
MARIKDSLIGIIVGKIGRVVYRLRNGKVVAYHLPGMYNISHTKEAEDSRQNFSASVQLAVVLRKDPVLKQIWEHAAIDASSAYHKMMSYNNRRTHEQDLTLQNAITPPSVPLQIDSAAINNSAVEFILGRQTKNCNDVLSLPFSFYVCLYAYIPHTTANERFKIVLNSIEVKESPFSSLFSLPLSKNGLTAISQYTRHNIYIAAARLSSHSKACLWTSTCSAELS